MSSHPIASVFFPQDTLDLLIDSGRVDLDESALLVTRAGCRYRLAEAARVLREVATGEDPAALVGTVRTKIFITEVLGGELLGNSLLVDDNGYDVVPGMLATAVGKLTLGESALTEIDLLEALRNVVNETAVD